MDFHPEEPLRFDSFEIKVIDRFKEQLELLVVPVRSLERIDEVLADVTTVQSFEILNFQKCNTVFVFRKMSDIRLPSSTLRSCS